MPESKERCSKTVKSTEPTENSIFFAPMKFGDSNQAIRLFSAMNEMRKTGQMCDITLQISDITLPAHKVVLAAFSEYFNAMFNNEMLEKCATHVTMHDVDANSLGQLIEYAYTGQIVISEDNVQNLLSAASLLQIWPIREACCDFLQRQLNPSNCLGIRNFADAHSCEQLRVTSHKYALDNFRRVSLTDEFLLLPFDDLSKLISDDQLNVVDEEIVYNAVIRWLKRDVAARQKYFSQLLGHVRLPLMASHFLINQVADETLVRQNSEAKDLLIEAMRYHLRPDDRAEVSSPRAKQRCPEGLQPYIFVIGGNSISTKHRECEYYNPIRNEWTNIASTNQPRTQSGIVSVGRHIYAIGGYDGPKSLSSVEFYDPLTNAWNETIGMGTKRSCLGVAALNDFIFAAGGYDGESCLNSVVRYDPLTSAWFSVQSLEIKRRWCRLVAMNQSIYAIGGYDGHHYLSSVERYDPREGKWASVAPMINRRGCFAAVELNGKLWVTGGTSDGKVEMCSAERYDPIKNGWEDVPPMLKSRRTHDMVQLSGCLYSLGGYDGSNSLNTVECYDPARSQWTLIKSMNLERCNVGAAVIYCNELPL